MAGRRSVHSCRDTACNRCWGQEIGGPMFPRHLQSVGSRCMVGAGHPRFSCMTRDFNRCPWWASYYPQTFYQPTISSWHPQRHWRPYPRVNYQRPALLGPAPVPWMPGPSSWIHTSHFNMDSKAEEQMRKRRKSAEGDDRGPRSWPKRSYPPAGDFSVPPAPDTANVTVPSGAQPEVRATAISRKWEDFSHLYCQQSSEEPASDKFDFSVMSYNILSQNLLEDNPSLYSHCRRPYLFWHYRLANILRELEERNSDILCLQEVQKDHYEEEIKPRLEALGYCCEFKARTGSKPDGCAICFKSDKFSLLLVRPVEYYRRHISLLDRDNIGLVLTLQPKTGKSAPTFCVANTHLLYNPRRGDIKLAQLAILLAEITTVAQLQDGRFCPIILCGDFNSVPGSPLHRFIKEGKLNYAGMTIGKVSGQEESYRGQRILSIPIWPKSLGITQQCVYESYKAPEEKEDHVEIETKNKEPEQEEETKNKEAEQEEETNKREDSKLQHHFSLSSVYSHVFPDTGVPEITTCHSKSAITVDYIFYSPANDDISCQPGATTSSSGLQLLGRLSLLTEKDLWSYNGLPNKTNSSDHLSLMARFRLAV